MFIGYVPPVCSSSLTFVPVIEDIAQSFMGELARLPGGSGVVSEFRDDEVVGWPYLGPEAHNNHERCIYVGSASVLGSPRPLPYCRKEAL